MRTLSVLLTVLFVGLKLINYIDWNWLIVLSPSLIWLILVLVFETSLAILNYLSTNK